MNSFTIEAATTTSDLKPVGQGRHASFRSTLFIGSRTQIPACVKIVTVEGLAKEALCSVLGRRLGLPIPRPFYVYIDRGAVIQSGAAPNGMNTYFGTEQDRWVQSLRHLSDVVIERIKAWPDTIPCAVFDSWIGNNDRLPENLLLGREGAFWMIDHEDALASDIATDRGVGSPLFDIVASSASEHEKHQILRSAREWALKFQNVDWGQVLDDTGREESEFAMLMPLVSRHIEVLRVRAQNMERILRDDLRVAQMSLLDMSDRPMHTRKEPK